MIIRKCVRCSSLALIALLVLGHIGFSLEANPEKEPFKISSQLQKPFRPDIDENDRWRDNRFDMDGVLDELEIRPGMFIAEVGAGEGYLTFKLARRISPDGKILAEDIDAKSLEILTIRASERGLTNIETVLGTEYEPLLPPEQLDMIFMHAVIQFVADRPRFLRAASAGLKENGRFVIIEPESPDAAVNDRVMGPGPFPTRKGYLEIFRLAGLVMVSAEKKRDRTPPRIGSSGKTVFVLKRAPKFL